MLKNVKNVKNDPISNARSSVVYDDVFLLEVDSEPSARDLFATRFSAQSEKLAFSGFFEKLEISEEKKCQKMRFCAFSRQPVGGFSKKFFCLKGLPKAFKKVFYTRVAATHRLAAIPKFRLFHVQIGRCLIENPIFCSWLGWFFQNSLCSFFLKNHLV